MDEKRNNAVINIKNLKKSFGEMKVLDGITLQLHE
jgi:ABC-type sugar transport system ATPase subunit